MRLETNISILATGLPAVLWFFGAKTDWGSVGVMVYAGLGVAGIALSLGYWVRNRQRRRLADMRDSALW
jgi:hypothetical protein